MANDDKVYNEDIKERYLENYESNSVQSFSRVFKKISVLENQSGKDLYEFSRDEVKNALFMLNPDKLNTSKFNRDTIRSYIDWAIQEGYRRNKINPLSGTDSQWCKQFVDPAKKTTYHKDEISKLISLCVNDQDKGIIIALFEGVTAEELLLLKPNDIDKGAGLLNLIDKSGVDRPLKVTHECIELLLAASKQEFYEKSNGDAIATTKSPKTELINNGYVIMVSNTKAKDNDDGVEKNVIYRRFETIQESIKDYAYITPLNVRNSGMLYMAHLLYEQDGQLKTKQLDKICRQFKVKWNPERKIFNRYNLTGDFLNKRTIEEVYADNL